MTSQAQQLSMFAAVLQENTQMTMTQIPGVPDKSSVKPGMAFFAGTSPVPGSTCASCVHLGYWRQGKNKTDRNGMIQETHRRHGGCKMYLTLTHRHGPPINRKWPACKYYERRTS